MITPTDVTDKRFQIALSRICPTCQAPRGDFCDEETGGMHELRVIEEMEARLKAVRSVIEYGYPGQPGKLEKCPHDRYGYEDCIQCYDEALLAAIDGNLSERLADNDTDPVTP